MVKHHFSRVLITGTTSGLGRAFHEYYVSKNVGVIEVNRRATEEDPDRPVLHSEVLDITNPGEVFTFLMRLQRDGMLPDLFILNAGINLPDCIDGFDYQTFSKVMNINLNGALTFISAVSRLDLKGMTIATISSTSNIIPNSANLAYHLSKLNLAKVSNLLVSRDQNNYYKTVVLGPVHTNITANSPPLVGFTKLLFNLLAISPQKAAGACAKFFEGSGKTFYFTKLSVLFYFGVRFLLIFFPFLYSGTKREALLRTLPKHSSASL